ncbi:MAG: hypothetical protein K6T83_06280 [Alicyclobacillus sp.]|nr:hypothetical protein [Alicyclobacillus sp.]
MGVLGSFAFRLQAYGYSLPDVYAAAEDEVIPVGIHEGVTLRLRDIFEHGP